MALPGLVLIHGGGLAGDSWNLVVDEIHRQEPSAIDQLSAHSH